MKIALLYPYTKMSAQGCNPPISLLYIGASLKQSGNDVLVIDKDHGNLSNPDMLEKLKDYSPDLIGLPIFANTLPQAYELVNQMVSAGFKGRILIGGPHASIRPQEVLEDFSGCDYVLRGEAENSIVKLAQCIGGRKDFKSVNGLSYRDGDRVVHNPDASPEMDLDRALFPARELLSDAYAKKTYWRIGTRGTTDVIITSRGCPYNCNFCFKVCKKFRMRSPENIIAELTAMRSMGTRSVHIMDDIFAYDKARCLRVLGMIKNSELGMEFKVRARVDGIDEELLAAMKESGVKSIVYGVESGSQDILDAMNKRTTVDMNYRAITLAKKAGLQCYADVLIGYPGETPESIAKTEELLLRARPTAINVSVMYPLPDTAVYNQAKASGILRDDWSVKNNDAWIQLPWARTKNDLYEFKRQILKRYLRNPVIVFNAIKSVLFNIDARQLKALARYFLEYAI
ncbi:MAG: radical SAM protein [Candidatus Omnitrophota bacterium]|nr:radical SAM protein [Candidatus Omnitrophota bacterium]